jgi:putative endonuclease
MGTDETAYTFKRRPVVLVYVAVFGSPAEAIRFEKQLKGWSRAKKEALMRGDWGALPGLAHSSRNDTRRVGIGTLRQAQRDDDASTSSA